MKVVPGSMETADIQKLIAERVQLRSNVSKLQQRIEELNNIIPTICSHEFIRKETHYTRDRTMTYYTCAVCDEDIPILEVQKIKSTIISSEYRDY